MPTGSTLLLFTLTSLALLAVPGPAVIYVVSRSVEQGRRAGIVSMLGIETGTFAYALAATVGLSGLIAASVVAFDVVKYAGAAYLVYLGVRKLLGRAREHACARDSRADLFVRGLIVQLLNPKIAIFFVAFLPQFVGSAHGPAGLQMLILGSLFTSLAVLSDGAYALAAGTIGDRLRSVSRSGRVLERLSAAVYVGLGVGAALSGTGHARAAAHAPSGR